MILDFTFLPVRFTEVVRAHHFLGKFLTNDYLFDSVITLSTNDFILGMFQPPIQKQLKGSYVGNLWLSIGLPISSLTVVTASILYNDVITLLSAANESFWNSRKLRFIFYF